MKICIVRYKFQLQESRKTVGYSPENGGVSWPVPWVAKRPHPLSALTAVRAVAPPGVVPVGQSMPRLAPGRVAAVSTSYTRSSRQYAPPQSEPVSCLDVPQSAGIVPPDTWFSFWRRHGQFRRGSAAASDSLCASSRSGACLHSHDSLDTSPPTRRDAWRWGNGSYRCRSPR